MTYFIKDGNRFRITNEANMDLHKHLPVGNYVMKSTMSGELYLEQVDAFDQPKKIYGNAPKMANRILNTFRSRPNGTGVMLAGEKGSGKTLLAKILSIHAAADDATPTIMINHAYCGDNFNKFMQDIDQPAIILFDEFEKVYEREEQESILTLLDGVFPSKKLFVFTCNDKWRVDNHMRNRPGRIYYMLDFKGLEPNFIREYAEDNLKDKKQVDAVCRLVPLFTEFNFDMLKALIEEMNRYDETPQESLRMLNARPEFGDSAVYDVSVTVGNKKIDQRTVSPSQWRGNPLSGDIHISWSLDKEDEDGSDWNEIEFNQKDLMKIEPQDGRFVFRNEGAIVTLTRVRERHVDYLMAL